MTRGRDALVSGLGLVVLSPVLLAIALAVRTDSPGPVLFRQQRVGRGGRPFTMHKFRTMGVDAAGPCVTASNDVRVTRAGRVLRASKLDELPQLFDVLRGEMALVGPRPEVPHYVALWPEDLRPVILSVRPGITDPATAVLRHESVLLAGSEDPERTYVEVLLPAKARAYAEYVATRTFWGDVAILGRTAWAIVAPGKDADQGTIERLLGVPGSSGEWGSQQPAERED